LAVSDREKLELYEQLETWAKRLAASIAHRTGLFRWADDIAQDVLVALWEAVCAVDGRGDAIAFIKQRVQHRAKNAIKRYGRWDERELTGLLNEIIDDTF
jgi:DNA-directed RNA polymerase specialized sigma24 family protein